MSQNVPATTPVKRNRVRNIDTARLLARQGCLVGLIRANGFDSRHAFAMRALELRAVEDELSARGETFARRTLTAEQCAAMSS